MGFCFLLFINYGYTVYPILKFVLLFLGNLFQIKLWNYAYSICKRSAHPFAAFEPFADPRYYISCSFSSPVTDSSE